MMKNVYNFDDRLAANEIYGAWMDSDEIKAHYNAYTGKPQDLGLLQLPPPKRFLQEGSIFWVSPDVKYSFCENARTPYSTKLTVRKYHNIEDETLRLLKIDYFFIRDKDCMIPSKKGFRSVVYNVKKKALYVIQAIPTWKTTKKGNFAKKSNWTKQIRRVSLNSEPLSMLLNYFELQHVRRFVDDLKDIISKEVPDVDDVCVSLVNRIVALILQHRVGKDIPNLNDNFINNLSMMAEHQFIEDRLHNILDGEREEPREPDFNMREEQERETRKLKRNSVYKFIPTLIETNSIKKALQVLLDECYVGVFTQILFDVNWKEIGMRSGSTLIRYKKDVPKALQHYVSQSLKTMSKEEFDTLFRNVIDLTRSHHVEDYVKDAWIRIIMRLKLIIPFNTWKDTYSMSSTLNMRIRPNRFGSIADVLTLHDNLSRALRRNRNIANPSLVIDKNAKFVDIEFPEEFEGFKFKQLLTPRELLEETDIMGHCVHTYDRSCIRGDSIIFSAIGPDGCRWTVEYSGFNYIFVQAEGRKSENNGDRFFCPSDIVSKVFAPFTNIIIRHYSHPIDYKTRCTLNLEVSKLKDKICAQMDILDADILSINGEKMGANLDLYNCLLEDVISFDNYIKCNKLDRIEATNYVNDLIDKIEDFSAVGNKPTIKRAGGPRRAVRAILPDIAAPVHRLFPNIPANVIRAGQA